jgi:hypothetical protein
MEISQLNESAYTPDMMFMQSDWNANRKTS